MLHNSDGGAAGGCTDCRFSEVYQTINTVPGATYAISYDVWATPIHNTAGNAACTSTDSNGLLAINPGALQLGCEAGGFCLDGDVHFCPTVDGGWETVTGTYTATSPMTTVRLHSESTYDAYFDNFSFRGRPSTCNLIVNGALKGPVVDNAIAGWESHNAEISVVEIGGRAGVIRNGDAGGMSDLYQTVNVVPDVSYTIR